MASKSCYLALHGFMEDGLSMTPCNGRLIRAHLLPQQLLKRLGHNPRDPRSWVYACGGMVGIGGHHAQLDLTRRLHLARSAIPPQTEQLARELGLEWWLEREYGT